MIDFFIITNLLSRLVVKGYALRSISSILPLLANHQDITSSSHYLLSFSFGPVCLFLRLLGLPKYIPLNKYIFSVVFLFYKNWLLFFFLFGKNGANNANTLCTLEISLLAFSLTFPVCASSSCIYPK